MPYTLLAIRTMGELIWEQRLEEMRVKINLVRLGHLNSQSFSNNLLLGQKCINTRFVTSVLFQVRNLKISTSERDFGLN